MLCVFFDPQCGHITFTNGHEDVSSFHQATVPFNLFHSSSVPVNKGLVGPKRKSVSITTGSIYPIVKPVVYNSSIL